MRMSYDVQNINDLLSDCYPNIFLTIHETLFWITFQSECASFILQYNKLSLDVTVSNSRLVCKLCIYCYMQGIWNSP